MTEREREVLRMAIDVLNGPFGGEAAWFLEQELALPENEEAEALIASMWEPEFLHPIQ